MYEEAVEMMFEDAVGSNDSKSDNRKEQIETVINIAKDVLKEFKEKYPDAISHGVEASTTKEQKDEFCEWSDDCQIMSGDITKFDNFNDNDSNKEINEKCWSIVDEITNELSKRVKEDSSLTGKISGDGDKLDFYICYELKFDETPVKESVMYEDVGDADDNRPKSDHPVKDFFMDIDRATVKNQQKTKRTIQNIQNAGRAAMKPINRTKDWIGNMIADWKDADENNVKEKMADPHARNNLFSAVRKAITGMALLRAGVLLNPMFIFLAVTKGIGKDKKEFRLRNEMIGEIKTEIEIVEKKIAEAEADHDMDKMAKLMRFKNEMNKKLLRVGGSPQWKKII